MSHSPFPCVEFSEELLEYIQIVVIPSRPLEVRFKQNCLDELENKDGWQEQRRALKKEVDDVQKGYDEMKKYRDELSQQYTSLKLAKELTLRLQYEKHVELMRKRTGLLRVRDETDPAGKNFKNIPGEVGIVEKLSDGREGYVAIDNKEYPVPTYEMIQQKFRERCDRDPVFLKKFSQGFYHMLLVPKGAKLIQFVEQYESTLLECTEEGGAGLFQTGDTLEKPGDQIMKCPKYDSCRGVYVDETYCKGKKKNNQSGGIIYDSLLLYGPYYEDGKIVGGKTKEEYLKEGTFPGWDILFLEKDVRIPAYIDPKDDDYSEQVEKITHGGRRRFEANSISITYMQKLQEDPQYEGERGMTPEEWLLFADMIASTSGQVIDDWQNDGKENHLTGAVFASGSVPYVGWFQSNAQALFSACDPVPFNRRKTYGFRSVVLM